KGKNRHTLVTEKLIDGHDPFLLDRKMKAAKTRFAIHMIVAKAASGRKPRKGSRFKVQSETVRSKELGVGSKNE
ncbi:MAG TPA: hypothetical protein PKJ77_10430, partial [Thermodesulfobacteriota bacterium]|nr:hypothetical protein [Thermodesulfobacteriota bacterium]